MFTKNGQFRVGLDKSKSLDFKPSSSKKKNFRKNQGEINLTGEYIQKLLGLGIVESSAGKSLISSPCKIIPKANGEARLIVNYSRLTPVLRKFKINLLSIFDLIKKKKFKFEPNKKYYFMKLDLTNAFFNIPLDPASRFLTTFNFDGIDYQFTRMPFGLSMAPAICQTLANSICKWCRLTEKSVQCWAHIDDFIFVSQDYFKLKNLVNSLVEKLTKLNWKINEKKSIFEPVEEIEFLGAIWNSEGIRREEKIDLELKEILKSLKENDELEPEKLEKFSGFLNYYLKYSTNGKENIGFIFKHLMCWNFLSDSNKRLLLETIENLTLKNFISFNQLSKEDEIETINFEKRFEPNLNLNIHFIKLIDLVSDLGDFLELRSFKKFKVHSENKILINILKRKRVDLVLDLEKQGLARKDSSVASFVDQTILLENKIMKIHNLFDLIFE